MTTVHNAIKRSKKIAKKYFTASIATLKCYQAFDPLERFDFFRVSDYFVDLNQYTNTRLHTRCQIPKFES